ncbi:hypothetical protein NL369_27885, partial [Klebsiella pneumoniae]|nr:hypothetical protein [Klebsiella pneumoniae]
MDELLKPFKISKVSDFWKSMNLIFESFDVTTSLSWFLAVFRLDEELLSTVDASFSGVAHLMNWTPVILGPGTILPMILLLLLLL